MRGCSRHRTCTPKTPHPPAPSPRSGARGGKNFWATPSPRSGARGGKELLVDPLSPKRGEGGKELSIDPLSPKRGEGGKESWGGPLSPKQREGGKERVPAPRLRPGLRAIDSGDRRSVVVIDDWSGRLWRLSRGRWQRLVGSAQPTGADIDQAIKAGWLGRSKTSAAGSILRVISFQTPLGSIEPLARRMAPAAAIAFHPAAALIWTVLGGWAALQWIGRDAVATSFSPSPIWLALTFLLTKTIHELGHAVAAVRMGCSPGKLGLWWMAGAPCPYVDVSSVWRLPTRWRRAVVMGGGMWAEFVLAVIAAWVALLTSSPAIQVAAMHVVAVAGISTVLFNGNPLMRYDGYYLLSDWLDTTDLRRDGREAWVAMWTRRRWPGPFWLPAYHAAGSIYRVFIQIAIAGVVIHLAGRVGLSSAALLACLVLAAIELSKASRRAWGFCVGSGQWCATGPAVRWLTTFAAVAVTLAALIVPTPRYATVRGVIEPAGTVDIYPPPAGRVAEVFVRVGQRVTPGQLIARIDDLSTQLGAIDAELAAATWRRRIERLGQQSLMIGSRRGGDHAMQAMVVAAGSADSQAQTAAGRLKRLTMTSPRAGWVLPPTGHMAPELKLPVLDDGGSLGYRVGQNVTVRSLCRVAGSDGWIARLTIDPETASQIGPATTLRLVTAIDPAVVLTVAAGEIRLPGPAASEPTETGELRPQREPTAVLVCHLAGEMTQHWHPVIFDQSAATATIHLPARPAWRDAWTATRAAVGW